MACQPFSLEIFAYRLSPFLQMPSKLPLWLQRPPIETIRNPSTNTRASNRERRDYTDRPSGTHIHVVYTGARRGFLVADITGTHRLTSVGQERQAVSA